MAEFKNLTGMKFGRLTAIKRAKNSGHHTRWECQCECGSVTISHTTSLTSGRAKSCGCLSREKLLRAITTHGGRHTRLYGNWCNMKVRCYNPNHEHYAYYGGRGISVCDAWRSDFAVFRDWAIKNGYQDGLTIDRIDVNGNYEPSNCKWATQTEQVRNRSITVFVQHNGAERPLKEWCEIYGANYKLAHARYKRGVPFEAIFNVPAGCTYLDTKGALN